MLCTGDDPGNIKSSQCPCMFDMYGVRTYSSSTEDTRTRVCLCIRCEDGCEAKVGLWACRSVDARLKYREDSMAKADVELSLAGPDASHQRRLGLSSSGA